MASVTAITANIAALMMSAVRVLPAATITPPSAGPAMKQMANDALAIALPSRSRFLGVSTDTDAARAIARAVSPTAPSASASASVRASEKCPTNQASARKATISSRYSAGRTWRTGS